MLLKDLIEITKNDESIINYLINQGIVNEDKRCPKCRNIVKISVNRKTYRCTKKSCGKEIGLFRKTFMENCNLGLGNLFLLTYLYLHKVPTQSILLMLGIGSETMCSWTKYIRQLLADNVEFEDVVIGGKGIIVEIDETKLGKRKYNKGHWVEGVWVLVGVERTPEKRIFAIEVPDRSAETLLTIIQTHVKEGSIINTDGWRSYESVTETLGMEHNIVNHKKHFKDPITGTHTNTVEGMNNGLKTFIKARNRNNNTNNINDYLYYFIWYRQNKDNLWDGFINAIKDTIYQ